jgi:hypothetical protein
MRTFDKATLKQFKRAYTMAVKKGHPSFIFKDNEVLCNYAKYVIEYLTGRLKGSK